MAIQISYTSSEIETLLGKADGSVQGSDLKGLAATLTAADSTTISSTAESPADLNSYTTPGVYKVTSATAAKTVLHRPDGAAAAFRLVVMETTQSNLPRLKQFLLTNTTENTGIYVRHYDGSSFGDWYEMASTDSFSSIRSETAPEMVMYSSFEWVSGGWWTSTGGLSDATKYHSGLVPIIPGARHYLGFKYQTTGAIGAFFDEFRRWLAPLTGNDVTAYPAAASGGDAAYKTPNGNGGTSNYANLWYFDAPAGACYFSWNLSTDDSYKYRQSLSSKPLFLLEGSGNCIVRPGDPLYQGKKNKKLCVIGSSTVMIDRFDRDSQGNDTPYVVGFQEYLAPWYQLVESYGFSGGSLFPVSGETTTSIYNGIVTADVDLSGYDEFLLQCSGNGLNTDDVVDDWDSTDTSKYFGALNGIIDYIYSQNPKAKIYLMDLCRKKSYYTYAASYAARIDGINEKIRTLAENRAYTLVPTSVGCECNAHTYDEYTYDGAHANSEGNRIYGLFCRKVMLGF